MKKNQKITNILYLFFLLLPFVDVITSLFQQYHIHFSLGIIIKVLFLLVMTIHLVFFSKSKYKKAALIYLGAITLYGLIFILTKNQNWSSLIKEASMFLKYFYLPICFITLLNFFNEYKFDKNKIINILLITLGIYIIFLIVPTILHINFKTYEYSALSGSIGWFYSANEVGATLLMLVPFSFLLINNDKLYKWLYILIFVGFLAILNIGTKVTYLGLIVVSIFCFIIANIKNKKVKAIYNYVFISLFLFIFLASLITPTIANITKKANNSTDIMCYNPSNKNDYKVYDYKYYKYLNMLLSGRELKVEDTLNIYQKSSNVDKLFGIGFTNRPSINNIGINIPIEIDFLDIFFHYGLFGFILIMCPFIYLIIELGKHKFKKDYKLIGYIFITLLTLGVAAVAGHVLSSPAVSIYLVIYMLLILNEIGLIKSVDKKEYNLVKSLKALFKKLFKIYKKYQEIINYLIVGGLTTVVSFVSFFICVRTFLNASNSVELQIANIISWVCAVVFAYFANRMFVFNSKNKHKVKEFLSFTSARVITLLMDMFIMFLCVSIFKMNDLVAKLIVQIIVTIANYILSKLFVFKKENEI